MSDDTFNYEQLTDDGGGFEFLSQAVKTANSPNAFEDKSEFKAIVISPGAVLLRGTQLPGIIGTGKGENALMGHGSSNPGYYGYRVRITEENSPHAFLPMPCGKQSANPEINNLLMETHTLGYTTNNQLKEGDEVLVNLRTRDGMYDLGYARIIEKIGTNKLKLTELRSQTGTVSCELISTSFGSNSINFLAGENMQSQKPIEYKVGGPSVEMEIMKAYPQVNLALAQAIVDVAIALGIPDPGWLANLINIESAGTFSASTVNKSSGATGLIQFYPGSKRENSGVANIIDRNTGGIFVQASTGEPLNSFVTGHRREACRILGNLTEVQQMAYVQEYLMPYKGRMKTQTDVIAAVFMPAYVGINPYQQFQNAAAVASGNPGIRSIADYYMKFYPNSYKLPTSLS